MIVARQTVSFAAISLKIVRKSDSLLEAVRAIPQPDERARHRLTEIMICVSEDWSINKERVLSELS